MTIDSIERGTLTNPLYKKIDRNGRIYIDKKLAGKEVLIIVVKAVPHDKINFIKVGR